MDAKFEQMTEEVKVEHENLIRTVRINKKGFKKFSVIDGNLKRLYPTGNPDEPWTTNIAHWKGSWD